MLLLATEVGGIIKHASTTEIRLTNKHINVKENYVFQVLIQCPCVYLLCIHLFLGYLELELKYRRIENTQIFHHAYII